MTDYEERLREYQEKHGLIDEPEPPKFDPALVPTVDLLGPRRLDSGLTKLKERIDHEISVFDIYGRFMPPHKVRPHPKPGQRESIMFSCPTPTHPDNNPSAWCTDTGLWYCKPCGAKGDKFTIAAHGEGLDIQRDFREVCIRIADAFGLDYTRLVSAPIIYEPTEPTADSEPDVLVEPEPIESQIPLVPWEKVFPPNTFLHSFMMANRSSDSPDEYTMWGGLSGVGMALGRDCALQDDPLVFGNTFICFYGPSGQGKTRAMHPLMEVLRLALPYDHTDPASKGALMLPLPGSPEALIDSFSAPILDPVTNKIIGYGSVRGLLRVDELSALLMRGDRSAGLKSWLTTMYDSERASIKSRGAGSTIAEGIFCSMLTSTQPTAVAEILKYHDVLSGFVNRIVFVMGRPKKLMAIRSVSFDPTESVKELMRIRSWASPGRRVRFDDAGRAVFEEFFERMLMPLKIQVDAPLFARIDLTIKKIILLLAANDHCEIATADIVHRALMFFEYIRFTYEHIGGSVSISAEEEVTWWVTDAIRRFVSRTGKPPTGRDLQQLKSTRVAMKQIREALRTLEGMGIVRRVEIPTTVKGGRPTERFMLTELMAVDD